MCHCGRAADPEQALVFVQIEHLQGIATALENSAYTVVVVAADFAMVLIIIPPPRRWGWVYARRLAVKEVDRQVARVCSRLSQVLKCRCQLGYEGWPCKSQTNMQPGNGIVPVQDFCGSDTFLECAENRPIKIKGAIKLCLLRGKEIHDVKG